MTPMVAYLYEMREKALRDHLSAISNAKQRGAKRP